MMIIILIILIVVKIVAVLVDAVMQYCSSRCSLADLGLTHLKKNEEAKLTLGPLCRVTAWTQLCSITVIHFQPDEL